MFTYPKDEPCLDRMTVEIMAEEMEYSIHPPSPFIEKSWQALLPHWNTPVVSVFVLLQRSPILLCEATVEADMTKHILRDRSIQLLMPLVQHLQGNQYQATLFDPRTGFPYRAEVSGTVDPTASGLPLNDVAVIHAVLGYSRHQYGQCHCIMHPLWGSSVYPTILLSSSSPHVLHQVARWILGTDNSQIKQS